MNTTVTITMSIDEHRNLLALARLGYNKYKESPDWDIMSERDRELCQLVRKLED